MPVILATREMEIGRISGKTELAKKCEALAPK
jgi:hypothetical protein